MTQAQTKRLDILDLPRDRGQFTGNLRTILVKLVNFVRKHPRYAVQLSEMLIAANDHILMNLKIQEGTSEAPVKAPEKTIKQKLEALRLEASKAPDLAALAPLAAKIKATYPDTAELSEAKALVDIEYEAIIAKH